MRSNFRTSRGVPSRLPRGRGESCFEAEGRDSSPVHGHATVELVRVMVTVQLWLVPVPPQVTSMVDVDSFHAPTQPVRWIVPR